MRDGRGKRNGDAGGHAMVEAIAGPREAYDSKGVSGTSEFDRAEGWRNSAVNFKWSGPTRISRRDTSGVGGALR
jgi:hypothetical protein